MPLKLFVLPLLNILNNVLNVIREKGSRNIKKHFIL